MVSARLMKGLAGVIAVAIAVSACGGGDDDAAGVAPTHAAGTQAATTPRDDSTGHGRCAGDDRAGGGGDHGTREWRFVERVQR